MPLPDEEDERRVYNDGEDGGDADYDLSDDDIAFVSKNAKRVGFLANLDKAAMDRCVGARKSKLKQSQYPMCGHKCM